MTKDPTILIAGIDIGRQGAISFINEYFDLVDVVDMPVLYDGPDGRPSVNSQMLGEIIKDWGPNRAFIENVNARQDEGKVGAGAFGSSKWKVEGVLSINEVRFTLLDPICWKSQIGIPPGREMGKKAALAEALRRWPEQTAKFTRVKDDGRADACLIAVAGILIEHGIPATRNYKRQYP